MAQHVWVRIMKMPVQVQPDEDGEPLVIVSKRAIQNLVEDGDMRIGCEICGSSLDAGWDTPCKELEIPPELLEELEPGD